MTRSTTSPTRTDAQIFADVRHALDQRPAVPATVRAHVDHGVVTITGTVRRYHQSAEAEDAAGRVPGVRRVVNEIAVERLASPEGFEPPGGPEA